MIQYLISDIAASKESLFVYSLTDANKAIWSDLNHMRMSVGGRNRSRPFRNAYIWDLYRLAELVGEDRGDGSGFWTIDSGDINWNKIWVSSFNDNAGNIYEKLPTPFTVSPFTRPVATQQLYRASLRFSPLIAPADITTDENGDVVVTTQSSEVEPAELTFYKSLIYPAYPLMLASSIATHTHYGPIFLTSARIETSGRDKLKAVELALEIEGGKSIASPGINSENPEIVVIEAQQPTDSEGQPVSTEEQEINFDYRSYRTACLIDCLVAHKLYSTVSDMQTEMASQVTGNAQNPEERLVSVSLSVKQELSYEFPVTSKGRTDENGPRFASFPSRTVTGSLIYWSRQKDFEIPNTSALTLFFGGIWFFPMPNVEWQKPNMEFIPGSGYLHTFDFIARAAPNSIQKGFVTDAANYPISEFWLSSNDLSAVAGITQNSDNEEEQ